MHQKTAIRPGIDCHPVDISSGTNFKIYRAEYAAKGPEIAATFCPFDRGIGRLLAYRYFQQVGGIELQQRRDIIFKLVKTALVRIAGRLAIDLYFGVGHHAFEDDEYFFVLPGSRRPESIFILPLLIGLLFVEPIGIITKAHQLPLRRNWYSGPVTAFATFGAKKLPVHGMVFICAG